MLINWSKLPAKTGDPQSPIKKKKVISWIEICQRNNNENDTTQQQQQQHNSNTKATTTTQQLHDSDNNNNNNNTIATQKQQQQQQRKQHNKNILNRGSVCACYLYVNINLRSIIH